MELNLNQELIVTCSELSYEGYGLAIYNDRRIFVAGLLVNEQAKIRIVKKVKNVVFAKIIDLIKKSYLRSDFEFTSNADLIHLKHDEQIKFKLKYFKNLFTRNVSSNFDIENINFVTSKNIFNYRNKASVFVKIQDEILHYGYMAEQSNQFIFQEIDEMFLYADSIKNFLREFKFNFHKFENKKIFENLNQLIIRKNQENKLQVVLLFNKSFDHNSKELKTFFESINKNINGAFYVIKKSAKSFKLENHKIFGNENLLVEFANLKFNINVASFMQVNFEIANKIYDHVKQLSSLEKYSKIFDLYSGAGTIALNLANKNNLVTGVEIIAGAVENAKVNAKLNNIKNADFIKTSASAKSILEILNDHDLLVVDPPRNGLDSELVETIASSKIKSMIYVSCNPRTLIRDLKVLTNKFEIKSVTLFDMFPSTHHFEIVVHLTS
ncbi:23S rRNA (uracil(1939)-C(5))-methyltransferase RlmD [Mycoplasmopsis agassizii]|uniref:23S rRNA (Uracil(1939)-C(5))-methyltransferase RlmD n=1 Tax=Mycoplasmopsis agassizii TaxID=33922 RepID=A0ABX4H481_9BACT|nr:23S rRNA (uracil(1939)-C(5))-methyltransferase RlmD [Mycoplasmopsis agassizii]PAF54700.1 23S rRNA (uracil(1939)-C(5))-methyltransferase RlmD [Mycoplasmopsis agassizii]SMC15987.1 23S rRNA (uracil1939-C5)-methyltransferase [Mycoplasmopsis agassizii]